MEIHHFLLLRRPEKLKQQNIHTFFRYFFQSFFFFYQSKEMIIKPQIQCKIEISCKSSRRSRALAILSQLDWKLVEKLAVTRELENVF